MTLSNPSETSLWRRMMLSVALTLAIAGNSYLVSAPQLKQLSAVLSLADPCLKQKGTSPEPQHPVETVLQKVGVKECRQQRLTQLYPTQDQAIELDLPQLLTFHMSPESGSLSLDLRN